jgi:cell division protein FtsA
MKIKINAEELMRSGKDKKPESELARRRAKVVEQAAGVSGEEKEPEETENKEKKNKDIIDVSALEIEGVRTISRKMFEEIIEARLSEIFDVIIKQVEDAGTEARLPAGVVLTGGTGMIPGITNIAKKVFGIPARVGYPKGLTCLVDEISSPAYAVSQGLVMYASANEGYGRAAKRQLTTKPSEGGNLLNRVKSFFRNLIP